MRKTAWLAGSARLDMMLFEVHQTARLPRKPRFKDSPMFDLLYVGTALLFFALCWAFTKACEKL